MGQKFLLNELLLIYRSRIDELVSAKSAARISQRLRRSYKIPRLMFNPDFITNPYKTYSHLRTAAPLHWTDKFRNGAWLVSRYADVLAGLRDSRLSSRRSHTLTAALPSEVQGEFATFNRIFST